MSELFAFANKNDKEEGRITEAWTRFDWEAEFKRQAVNDAWKESNFNLNYAYCDTYPEKLWFPSGATTQTLIGSCKCQIIKIFI
jgi:hypothetical protein